MVRNIKKFLKSRGGIKGKFLLATLACVLSVGGVQAMKIPDNVYLDFFVAACGGDCKKIKNYFEMYKSDENKKRLVNGKSCDSKRPGSIRDGWTSLVGAAKNEREEILKILLPYADDESKNLALSIVVQDEKQLGIVRLLLKRGANCDWIDFRGQTALFRSVFVGDFEIFEMLLKYVNLSESNVKLHEILNRKDQASLRTILDLIVRKHPLSVEKSINFIFNNRHEWKKFFRLLVKHCCPFLNFESKDLSGYSVLHSLAHLGEGHGLRYIFRYIKKNEEKLKLPVGSANRYISYLLALEETNGYSPLQSAEKTLENIKKKVTNVYSSRLNRYIPDPTQEEEAAVDRLGKTIKYLSGESWKENRVVYGKRKRSHYKNGDDEFHSKRRRT
ncbi:hypothetical protein KAT92_00950 [Candidatus Babeliales bacterium]|nr:hypothetical protein [Candidatus Babeliales bacterium]